MKKRIAVLIVLSLMGFGSMLGGCARQSGQAESPSPAKTTDPKEAEIRSLIRENGDNMKICMDRAAAGQLESRRAKASGSSAAEALAILDRTQPDLDKANQFQHELLRQELNLGLYLTSKDRNDEAVQHLRLVYKHEGEKSDIGKQAMQELIRLKQPLE